MDSQPPPEQQTPKTPSPPPHPPHRHPPPTPLPHRHAPRGPRPLPLALGATSRTIVLHFDRRPDFSCAARTLHERRGWAESGEHRLGVAAGRSGTLQTRPPRLATKQQTTPQDPSGVSPWASVHPSDREGEHKLTPPETDSKCTFAMVYEEHTDEVVPKRPKQRSLRELYSASTSPTRTAAVERFRARLLGVLLRLGGEAGGQARGGLRFRALWAGEVVVLGFSQTLGLYVGGLWLFVREEECAFFRHFRRRDA
ncbi:hypothetical protein Q7P37_001063 [Cladosporium fusiforme]